MKIRWSRVREASGTSQRARTLWPIAMVAGLAFMVWGETAHPHIVGAHGTQLATAIALTVAAAGWIGWAVAGPTGTSSTLTAFVSITGLAGSVLLVIHPATAICWFTVWACIDAGAALPPRLGVVLAVVCGGVLLAGYLAHRGDLLATLAAVTLVAYVIGLNRRYQARAATLAERGRIAADLHDILGHSLTALSLQVQAAAAALDPAGDVERARTHLERAAQLARSGQEETVAAVRTLRDGTVGVDHLATGLIATSGVPAQLTVRGSARPLPASVGMATYRLLQEALANAGKHSPGSEVTVILAYDPDTVTVTVDNSTSEAGTAVSGGNGIPGMRQRVAQLGGTLAAGPVGDQWRVHAELPA